MRRYRRKPPLSSSLRCSLQGTGKPCQAPGNGRASTGTKTTAGGQSRADGMLRCMTDWRRKPQRLDTIHHAGRTCRQEEVGRLCSGRDAQRPSGGRVDCLAQLDCADALTATILPASCGFVLIFGQSNSAHRRPGLAWGAHGASYDLTDFGQFDAECVVCGPLHGLN